jgi:hypothetical protein
VVETAGKQLSLTVAAVGKRSVLSGPLKKDPNPPAVPVRSATTETCAQQFFFRGLPEAEWCPWRIDRITRRLESGTTLDSASATRMNRDLLVT